MRKIHTIYTLSWRDAPLEERQPPQRIVFKIREPEKDTPAKEKVQPEAPNPPERAASASPTQEKPRKRKFQELPPVHLEALGKSHMDMVREGRFPELIFSYASPRSFIQEMYRLGCKTLLYDRETDSYHETQLFKGEVLFRQKKIDVSEILTVGSLFEHGKLMIKRAHMKDGSVVEIDDVSGT